jgi:signal transduction histidine kinase
VPPEDRERIFEPYTRAHAAAVPGSMGLGLPVSRRLARLMNGDLAYAFVDGESIFELTLPGPAFGTGAR